MFERYTEKARRVIFFARYEASNYGSREIESQHVLLGLLRVDHSLLCEFIGERNVEAEIRAEIERRIVRGERFSVSVEVPLSDESKKILNLAAEESERLAHRQIGTEHLLLGMLRVEGSLAAEILRARNLTAGAIREQLTKSSGPTRVQAQPDKRALWKLDSFLGGLKWHSSAQLAPFFAENAHFVDVSGKEWNREQIVKQFETLFAPYAKKNATYAIEKTIAVSSGLLVALVLWKNAILASEQRIWMHRMGIVLVREGDDWAIALAQVTAVQPVDPSARTC